jgi:hypothetical protein
MRNNEKRLGVSQGQSLPEDATAATQTFDTQSLVIGDRNAILVAARISGYGKVYETKVGCPSCGEVSKHIFDLSESSLNQHCFNEEYLKEKEIELRDNIFYTTLPKTQVCVGMRLLTGKDELYLMNVKKKKKSNDAETAVTDQLSNIIVSVNDDADPWNIRRFIEVLPISDSQYVRNTYKQIIPNLDLSQVFGCMGCGHVEDVEVPFNAEFFWPN